jgi:ribosomal protein L10
MLIAYGDLPSLDVLRAKLVGLINAPASRIAQVIKAKSEKAEQPAAPAA